MEEIPIISEDIIQQKTWQILNEAYPDGIPVPIPIEELIELHFKIGLEIQEIVIPEIENELDGYTDFVNKKYGLIRLSIRKGKRKEYVFHSLMN